MNAACRQGDGAVLRWRQSLAAATAALMILAVAWRPLHAADAPRKPDHCHSVYVADHGWHTGLILLRQDFDPRAALRTTYFDDRQWLEFGWGDAAFYQAEEMSVGLALRALFSPTDAVMHVYAFNGMPAKNFPESEVVRVRVTQGGYRRMIRFIRDAFARDQNGHVMPLKRGLYGRSHFFKALGIYSMDRTCNTWTAEALREAGLAIDPAAAATSGGVISQLAYLKTAACAEEPARQ